MVLNDELRSKQTVQFSYTDAENEKDPKTNQSSFFTEAGENTHAKKSYIQK